MKSLLVALFVCLVGVNAQAAYLNLDQSAWPTQTVSVQVLNNTKVIMSGNFSYLMEGTNKAVRTNVIDEPVVLEFLPVTQQEGALPLVEVVSLIAHGNVGEECEIPTVTYCGINTYDYTSYCQEEMPLWRDVNGCYRSYGQWNTNSPLSEFRVLFVEVRNMVFWKFSIVEASVP